MADVSPTVRQRELGARLRRLRNGLGLTVEDEADKLLCSPTKISRVETGTRKPTLRDVRDLCALHRVSPADSDELMDLARQARKQGWWTQYDDLNLEPYIGLEQNAVSITCFTMFEVPTLMQTENYARAPTRGVEPKIDLQILEQWVEVQIRWQQLLERARPPRYRAIVDEAVLHRDVSGHAVMQAQLEKT